MVSQSGFKLQERNCKYTIHNTGPQIFTALQNLSIFHFAFFILLFYTTNVQDIITPD